MPRLRITFGRRRNYIARQTAAVSFPSEAILGLCILFLGIAKIEFLTLASWTLAIALDACYLELSVHTVTTFANQQCFVFTQYCIFKICFCPLDLLQQPGVDTAVLFFYLAPFVAVSALCVCETSLS